MDKTDFLHSLRNLIITGIPRSGTSLFCQIANSFNNIICLNEILYNINRLVVDFQDVRKRALRGEQILNRYDKDGNLTTNIMKMGKDIQYRKVDKPIKENVVIGSKVNAPYMLNMDALMSYGFNIFVVIRHPVYTIGSYQMPWTKTLNEANPFTDQRYNSFYFEGRSKIEAQAQIWEFYAKIIQRHESHIETVRYEDIVGDTKSVVRKLAKYFEERVPRKLPKIKNMNDPDRYRDIDKIRKAVEKYCPSMERFGYKVGD